MIIPRTPQTVKIAGKKGSWIYCPLLDLAYREKSGILQAKVAHEPVTADMEESQRYALVLPCTVSGMLKSSPEPPALCTIQPRVAIAVMGAATSLTMKRYLSLVGGISSSGNWMIQNRKYEIIPLVVMPASLGR